MLSTMNHRWLTAGVGVLAVGLVAACGRGPQDAAVAGGPTTTTTVAGATTTTAVPVSTTVASTTTTLPERLTERSRLRLDGIGPITVGMTLAEATAAAGTPVRVNEPVPIGDGSCQYARAEGAPAGLWFMVFRGRIVRIDVFGDRGEPSSIATLSGVKVGSTEAEVMAAYPGRITVQRHPYTPTGHYLVYNPVDPASRAYGLIFETDGRRVGSFRSGLADPVQWIEGCA